MHQEGISDIRQKWSEDKRNKISALEIRHQHLLQTLSEILIRRNNLSVQKVPMDVITIQVQGLVVASEMAALVDTLEGMGKIDRLDYMINCVKRFENMAKSVDGVH